jgi:Ser/Thr protein kinase RdoA (MazF antagonist)
MTASGSTAAGVDPTPYAGLGPDQVLDAVESVGLPVDGRLLALNSYENRVYQVGIDDAAAGDRQVLPRRALERRADPGRARLHVGAGRHEMPVVPPLVLHGETLHRHLSSASR